MAYNHAKGYSHYVKDFGLVFIPVPKNGSSSFRRSCERCRISNVAVNFLKNEDLFITSKVVAVVNPDLVSRFISGFLEITKRKEKDPWGLTERILHFKSLEEQILEMIKILEEGWFYDAHIEKQSFYLTDVDNNALEFVDEYVFISDYSSFLKKYFNFSLNENKKPVDIKSKVLDIIVSNNLTNKINNLYYEDYIFIKNLTND